MNTALGLVAYGIMAFLGIIALFLQKSRASGADGAAAQAPAEASAPAPAPLAGPGPDDRQDSPAV